MSEILNKALKRKKFIYFGMMFCFLYLGNSGNICKSPDDPSDQVKQKNLNLGSKTHPTTSDTTCHVLLTIDFCFAKDVENPWKDEYFSSLYNYISTGYKVDDTFVLIPPKNKNLKQRNEGRYKISWNGWHHKHPQSKKDQQVVIKYWKNEDDIEKKQFEEIMYHTKWAIASKTVFKEKNTGNFIWTQPIIANCPNLITGYPDIAFIEPKVNFQRRPYDSVKERRDKWWIQFQDNVMKTSGITGYDVQCFDRHDFGPPFGTVIVMTDVPVEDDDGTVPYYTNLHRNFLQNFKEECI